MTRRHAFQTSIDSLAKYLEDARQIFSVIEERTKSQAQRRRDNGGRTGAGRPSAAHKSLNRAVVVASVGALEAFTEDLALCGLDHFPDARVANEWLTISGSRGMVQTPNSSNIARMYWSHFRYDPRPDWEIRLRASWSEVNGPAATSWRGASCEYSGSNAANALDMMVKVRHGFAHQDMMNAPAPTAGIVNRTPTGWLSLQSHHAFNSMSLVAQVAIHMTRGLTAFCPGLSGRLSWSKPLREGGLDRLLANTPAGRIIENEWAKQPF